MTERSAAVAKAARDHGLSEGAVAVLWDAILRGGGRMAQFSHPDLGGMGQWSGGMLQIGDMFNHGLKARVAAACQDLAAAVTAAPVDPGTGAGSRQSQWQGPGVDGEGTGASPMRRVDGVWWPADLGQPSASGAQNGSRYAYFAASRRLAIDRDGRVTLYDTGPHRILGVSQRQSHGSDLAFTAEDGAVDLARLRVVES